MGQLFSVLARLYNSSKPIRILMLGLDAAGKTTILYKLKLGELVTTIPTIGFNVETVQYKNLSLTIWDVGGQTRIRPLWKYYFQNTQALIYVVDSADHERMAEARDELHAVLSDDSLRDVKLLVYANKQDMDGAARTDDICKDLGLDNERRIKWYIQTSDARKGEGLLEGLEWLDSQLR